MADSSTFTLVYATFTIPGVHFWRTAPDEHVILRNLHRHLFHFKVAKQVLHDDRQVEFIALGQQAKSYMLSKYLGTDDGTRLFGENSCEMLARQLLEAFDLYSCEVSEDGENGAVILSREVR